MTHDLDWRDVRTMFEAVGQVEQEHNGNLKVTVSGHTAVFPMGGDTIANADQVMQIRHMLKDSDAVLSAETETHFLVVIDHQEARIFHTDLKGSVPEVVKPFDPDGSKGHVHSGHRGTTDTQHPHQDSYFEEVASNLEGAEKVLLFGSGQGSSSAMDQFVAWLGEHHPHLAERIAASVVVDASHLTEGQLLAKAREIYGN